MNFQKTQLPGKIYVGHIKNEISVEKLHGFFSKFGRIIDIEQPFLFKNQRKNYAFISFENQVNANWLIDAGSVVLDSHKLIIKKAFQQEVKKMKLDQDEKTTTVEPFNINGDASAVFSTEGPSTQEAAYKAMQESLDSDEHGTNLPKELHDGHFSKGKTLMRSAT